MNFIMNFQKVMNGCLLPFVTPQLSTELLANPSISNLLHLQGNVFLGQGWRCRRLETVEGGQVPGVSWLST